MFEHWFEKYVLDIGSDTDWYQYGPCVLSGKQPEWVPLETDFVVVNIKSGIVECYSKGEHLTERKITSVSFGD